MFKVLDLVMLMCLFVKIGLISVCEEFVIFVGLWILLIKWVLDIILYKICVLGIVRRLMFILLIIMSLLEILLVLFKDYEKFF